jgi:hypothetical protein
MQNSNESYMYFSHDRSYDYLYPMYGHSHFEPLEMKAGEKLDTNLQVYWSDSDLMPHDFSIVVQAEKSPVKIDLNERMP